MLTEAVIRDARPREKAYKLFDGGGLFVLVNPDGSRWWRFKYQYGGKERGISLGVYPATTLKQARRQRDEAKRLVADGLDPSHERRAQRLSQSVTFEVVAREAGVAVEARDGDDREGALGSGEVRVSGSRVAADQPDSSP